METKLLDMGNGAVGISLGKHVASALRLAPGDVLLVTVEGDGLRLVRKAVLDPKVNCGNLGEHASKMWVSTGPRRADAAIDVTSRQPHLRTS
jgi:hypothetical protein